MTHKNIAYRYMKIKGGNKMFEYYPEGWTIDTPENRAATQNISAVNDACRDGRILEGRALVCDSSHNLVVDLGCMKGIIPREEGALGIREGTTRDIAIISRVNRPVCFLVTGFEKKADGTITAILSRRAAQEKCLKEYISKLVPGDVIDARITHLESFGAFADIGCGIVALLPIDAISVSRIDHPKERFTVGMDIRAVLHSIEGNRVTLSHKELLGTWEENVCMFSPGETVAGIVRSVESYGIFVELTPNLAGLAETKDDVYPGQQASVYIKSIIPDRMKVKLAIVDTFDYSYRPAPPKYFFKGNHMDRFVYSPLGCTKEIITDFTAHKA
jgi:small subunit ribosomal protein S1